MKIMAGIVTYNPDITKFKENLNAINAQVSTIFVFDNGSRNVTEIIDTIQKFGNNAEIIKNTTNSGIGHALNQIMEHAQAKGADWVLLLDQDSITPLDMIEKYSLLINFERVGVICPRIFDVNTGKINPSNKSIEEIGICITSGSLNKVSAWSEIGKFREDFFIDSVDNEYCIRLFLNNYKILRDNEVILEHELGKGKQHKIRNTTNHNEKRRYYISRNMIYVAYKYSGVIKNRYPKRKQREEVIHFLDDLTSIKITYRRQIQFAILVLLYEDNKLKKIHSIIKGTKDGRQMAKWELEKG